MQETYMRKKPPPNYELKPWYSTHSFIQTKNRAQSADNSKLINPITTTELKQSIRKSKNKTAPGPDKIPSEIYKLLGEHATDCLKTLLNKFIELGHIPPQVLQSLLFPIFKKGNPRKCNNYRYIALS